jgi:acetolactate decarboxylase
LTPSQNLFAAVRIDGRFERKPTRTAAQQLRPHPPLLEATTSESVSEWSDLTGTVAGFRSPDYAQSLSVTGFLLHSIDCDRSRGGHVLGFTLAEATLRMDVESGLHLELPQTKAFTQADLSGQDVAREISAAEFSPRN